MGKNKKNVYSQSITYKELHKIYKEEDIFDIYVIKIYYVNHDPEKDERRQQHYELTRVELTASDISTSVYKKLNKVIKPINDAIRNNKFCYSSRNVGKTISWQIFYLLKEIISYCECNYYRGQSDNYTLNPGILRKRINEEYLNRFEDEYLELSRTYPNQLSYYKPQKFLERESALSLLQHYGFKTSLLDITSDPYIAMLFMISNSIDSYKEPTLYLFDVDIMNNEKYNLFTKVKKSNFNERISAQHGAFFNFDKLLLSGPYCQNSKNNKFSRIKTIKLQLCFDDRIFDKSFNDKVQSIYKSNDSFSIQQVPLFNILRNNYREKQDIDKIKLETLKKIQYDLLSKLNEFCYYMEDLYPDFEKQLQFLIDKYPDKKVDDQINYQLNI